MSNNKNINKQKFAFVDVDGVLNHEIWFTSDECKKVSKERIDKDDKNDYRRWFDPRCVELLNHLTDKTGAKIVVSSSWRGGRTVEELKKLFSDVGITGDVIDKTPKLNFKGLEGYNYSVPRGCEIKAWLETNKNILGDKLSKANYVILDDDSDMLLWQREKFLHVDSYCGLTYNVIDKAVQILNRN